MKQFKQVVMVVALLSGSALPVMAFEKAPVQVEAIVAEQTRLREEIQSPTGRFVEMPAFKRNRILAKQAQLLALLDGKATVAELSPDEHTLLSNQLAFIEAGLTDREDERIVCERVRKTGSKMVSKVCKSVAQINAEREAAVQQMQSPQGICNSSVCVDM
ncbi:MAG: hypothetical protein ACREO4_07340 [Lysobacter sp.]